METVLIQINNHKAYKLLEDLEDLNIIKVLKKSIQPKRWFMAWHLFLEIPPTLKILMD